LLSPMWLSRDKGVTNMDMTAINIETMTDTEVTVFLLKVIESGQYEDGFFDELAEDFA